MPVETVSRGLRFQFSVLKWMANPMVLASYLRTFSFCPKVILLCYLLHLWCMIRIRQHCFHRILFLGRIRRVQCLTETVLKRKGLRHQPWILTILAKKLVQELPVEAVKMTSTISAKPSPLAAQEGAQYNSILQTNRHLLFFRVAVTTRS